MSISVEELAHRVLIKGLKTLDLDELPGADRSQDQKGASGQDMIVLEGHKSEVTCAIALPDGRLATGSLDSENPILLWEKVLSPKATITKQPLKGTEAGVCALATVSSEAVSASKLKITSTLHI